MKVLQNKTLKKGTETTFCSSNPHFQVSLENRMCTVQESKRNVQTAKHCPKLVQILQRKLFNKYRYSFGIIKQFYLFPDDTFSFYQSQLSSRDQLFQQYRKEQFMHTIVTLLDTQWKAKLLDGFLSLKLHYIKKKVVGEFLNTIDQVVTKQISEMKRHVFVRLQSNKENYLIEAGDDSRQENMKLNKNIYTMTVDRSQTNPRFASEDLTPKNRPRVESEKQFYLGSQVGRNHITSHHVIIPQCHGSSSCCHITHCTITHCNVNHCNGNICNFNPCTYVQCTVNHCPVSPCLANMNACNVNRCNMNSCNVSRCNVNSYNASRWNVNACSPSPYNMTTCDATAFNVNNQKITQCTMIPFRSQRSQTQSPFKVKDVIDQQSMSIIHELSKLRRIEAMLDSDPHISLTDNILE